MEAILIWIWNNSWLAEAACDAVALLSMAGAVALMRRGDTRPAAQPEVAPTRHAKPLSHPEPAIAPTATRTPTPAPKPRLGTTVDRAPRRAVVQEALNAMDRWESNHRRPGRGIADLARLAGRDAGRGAEGGEVE
jgi:hypothetical protein